MTKNKETWNLKMDDAITDYTEITQPSADVIGACIKAAQEGKIVNVPKDNHRFSLSDNVIYKQGFDIFVEWWLLCQGLTDIIKALNIAMGRLVFNKYWSAEGSFKGSRLQFQEKQLAFEKKALRLDLPHKMRLVTEHIEVKSKELLSLENCIISINKVRKEIEHRKGIVIEPYCNSTSEGSPSVEMKWKGISVSTENDKGDIVDLFDKKTWPVSLKKDQLISTNFDVDRTKHFLKGQKIIIDVRQYYEIQFTGYLYLKRLIGEVHPFPVFTK